ncbi:MAG: KH domain-containing protein [Oscillospiraceae bacterium]|nr:KH domain-containing protein [Oscillospiraceae bacterium]
MMEIFTAQTLEEAKQKAADAFSAPIDKIVFTVLEEPKRFLGIFGKANGEYKIRAEYEAPVTTLPVVEKIAAPAAETAPAESPADVQPANDAAETSASVSVSDEKPLPADATDRMEAACVYLRKVLDTLAHDVTISGELTEHGIEIIIDGGDAGTLIGHRGDTLDALQYLTSMVANRGCKDYVRVSLNACNYRDKRRKALQELAQRLCKQALDTGRPILLEPMNPYERRIIHSAVTDIEGVSSSSSGEEPNRRVVIMPDSAVGKNVRPIDMRRRDGDRRRSTGRGGSDRGGRRGGRSDRGDRRNRGERRPTGEVRRLDLSTSFEKDYKRPKPEDALNTGVYGKIDLD